MYIYIKVKTQCTAKDGGYYNDVELHIQGKCRMVTMVKQPSQNNFWKYGRR